VPRHRGEEEAVRISSLVCGLLLVTGRGVAAPGPTARARPLPAAPTAAAAAEETMPQATRAENPADPAAAVLAMLGAFERGNVEEYVGWMSDEFSFVSNARELRGASPPWMTREEERSFAVALFRGAGRGPGGATLPRATRVRIDAGPATAIPLDGHVDRVRVTLERLRATIGFSDGSTRDLGGMRNVFDLVRTEAGWRVQLWYELCMPDAAQEPLASGQPPASSAPSAPRDTARTARDSLAAAIPARLSLSVRSDRARGALVFDLELPNAGGTLELFDVMGRRLESRDLAGLRPGPHRLSLDGDRYPSGVYFARLRQRDSAAVARVVWLR
jgi:hypothetical protein